MGKKAEAASGDGVAVEGEREAVLAVLAQVPAYLGPGCAAHCALCAGEVPVPNAGAVVIELRSGKATLGVLCNGCASGVEAARAACGERIAMLRREADTLEGWLAALVPESWPALPAANVHLWPRFGEEDDLPF